MVAHSGSIKHDDAPKQKPSSLSLSFGSMKGKPLKSCAVSGSSKAGKREVITGIGASGVVSAESSAAASGIKIIPKQALTAALLLRSIVVVHCGITCGCKCVVVHMSVSITTCALYQAVRTRVAAGGQLQGGNRKVKASTQRSDY